MKGCLNWGIIGTGGIAADFAQALAASSQGVLVSVVGSGPEKAQAFAIRWGVHHAANSVDEFADDPWIPQGQRQASANSFEVLRYGMAPELIRIDPGKPVYALEADIFADTLPNLEPAWPAMSHADTLGNLRVLDAWRARVT